MATYKTIERWNPRYVFLVGIAGGFRSDGLDKGDIVLSDVIYGYEYGKIREQFEPRYDWIYRCDTSLITGTRAFALSTDWADKIREIRPDGIRKAPKSLYGPIASGDKVVDNLDQEIFATVIRAWPKLLAIEMEGAGAAEAIELAKSAGYDVHFLMIRGISDMPQSGVDVTIGSQSGERNEWKKYAAEVAATFTISYIKNGLPDPPTIKSKNGIGVNKPELPTTDPLDVYLSHLVDDLSLWRGLGLRRNVPLEDTYISQFIDSSSPEAETTSDADLLQSLRDCTLQIRRILIEGPAGSGKSNLLRHWALNLANHSCPISSHDYIPIFMPLGLVEQLCEHCGSWNMPFVELVASIYPDASGKTSSALVDSLTEAIDSGAAMILLDAADEVSEEARSEMKSWLERISRSARRCPIVLTSRPGDYVFGMNSFEPMYLRSLNRKQRDLFISKWFQASDLKGQDQAMKELLACSPRLDIPQLAGNPLFLTMMCVEYELTQTLSATPGALLDQFTRILLDRWDEIRTVKRVKNREPFLWI